MLRKIGYSWLDLLIWLAALALLIPLVARFVEVVERAVREVQELCP